MSSASPVGSVITELARAVERQREALIAQDTSQLMSISDEVLGLLESVRAIGPLKSKRERDAFANAYVALRANAELLMKASSANARALAVLFDSAATYGRGGSAEMARPSRPISAA